MAVEEQNVYDTEVVLGSRRSVWATVEAVGSASSPPVFGTEQARQEWENEALLSASVTDEQLRNLADSSDLERAISLTCTVDATHAPIDTIGPRMPKLAEWRLSNSLIPSVRSLGTSLHNLAVLWLSRCGLAELDGIGALPSLQELYLAFNDISELSPLTECAELQVLDLEANAIVSRGAIEFLALAPSLQELTLRGNPVCEDWHTVRADVRAMVPQLRTLDDEDWDGSEDGLGVLSSSPPASPSLGEASDRELRFVTTAIKQADVARVFDVAADGRSIFGATRSAAAPPGRPRTSALDAGRRALGDAARGALRPATAIADPFGARRPLSAGARPPWEAHAHDSLGTAAHGAEPCDDATRAAAAVPPRTASRMLATAADERPATAVRSGYYAFSAEPPANRPTAASDLTLGGEVLCGVAALRRSKLRREAGNHATEVHHELAKEVAKEVHALESLDLEASMLADLRALKLQRLLAGLDGIEDDDGCDSEMAIDDSVGLRLRRQANLSEPDGGSASGTDACSCRSSQQITPTATPATEAQGGDSASAHTKHGSRGQKSGALRQRHGALKDSLNGRDTGVEVQPEILSL